MNYGGNLRNTPENLVRMARAEGLNDLRITPVGGDDFHHTKMMGGVRTYAYMGDDFTVESWLDALRKGRAFFSTGPLLEFKVDGRMPGEDLRLPPEGGSVTLEARVESIAPVSKVIIYRNGRIFKELPPGVPFREKTEVTESSCFSLYVEDPPCRLLDAAYPQAATNAVRVYVGSRKIRNRASAEYSIRWIDKLRTMAEAWPWWRSQAEKDHVFAQFDEARRVYELFAEQEQ